MIGLVNYEWEKLFRGRAMWLHLTLYLFTAGALLYASGVFEDEKTVILARSFYAETFIAAANDLIYLSAMVYAVWLSSRMFASHASDALTVQLSGRAKLTVAKWALGACIILCYALASWLATFALLNTLPYGASDLLAVKTIAMAMVHALQGFSLFALIACLFRTSHISLFVLAAVFLIDTLRSGLYRPEGLNHGQFLSHALLPTFTHSSGGDLVMMVSPWLVFTLHGLFLLMMIVLGLSKEY
ncbi:MAG: hypothetical protein ACOCU5_03370 [Bacillota bacterium]